MRAVRNMNFINRTNELSFLEEKWNKPEAQFIVLWGKRRVGKTELVKQFPDIKSAYESLLKQHTNVSAARPNRIEPRRLDEGILSSIKGWISGFNKWLSAFDSRFNKLMSQIKRL